MIPIVLVTGLSGAGKASILRALEDLGYDAVDNPPLTLLEPLVTRTERPLAIGLDARSIGFDTTLLLATLDRLRAMPGFWTRLVYAVADPAVLMRRFTETRRRHPLAPEGRVSDGIEQEVALTLPLRDAADLVFDTSDLPLPELRRLVERQLGAREAEASSMTVTLMSFAFPAGLPREADMVFDARFLRNPHYDPILRPMTGLDAAVADYIERDPDYPGFMVAIEIHCLRSSCPGLCRRVRNTRRLPSAAQAGGTAPFERWSAWPPYYEVSANGRVRGSAWSRCTAS